MNDDLKMDIEYDEEEEAMEHTNPIQSALQYQTGIILQFGSITTASVKPVIETILNCHAIETKFDKFVLVINSGGGCLTDTFALIDVIKGSKIPVHTVGVGQICSGGLLLFLAGQKGYRTLTPYTTIMSHQWSGFALGKQHELLSTRSYHDMTTKMVMDFLKKATGLTKREIEKNLLPPNDVYLTAKQALDLGICDEVKDFGKAVSL